MSGWDDVVKRRKGPRHIRELNTHGLLLRLGQIPKYIEEYLRGPKHYTGHIEVIDFGPINALERFGTKLINGVGIEKFDGIQIFSKPQINDFLDQLLKDFDGILPPIGLIFIVPGVGLRSIEESLHNPGLFIGAPFAREESTRFCAILMPLSCNPVFKGRKFLVQREMAGIRGLKILTAAEISYCLVAVEHLFDAFYPYVPEWLRTASVMELAANSGMKSEKIVLIGDACNDREPGIRFSTSGDEAAMHIGAAAALVKVFTDEDIAALR